jgi:hypothetical protein
VSSSEFDTPAVLAAFSIAVEESITHSSDEDIYDTNITLVESTVDLVSGHPQLEVTFQQISSVHSLGVREASTAISTLTNRLAASCSNKKFDAIIKKIGDKLKNPTLQTMRYHDVTLEASRVSEIVGTEGPTGEPSALPPDPEDGGSGGFTFSMPIIIAIVVVLMVLCAARQVYLCCTKPDDSGPRDRRMAVSNVQVLPTFQEEQRGHKRRVAPAAARGGVSQQVEVMPTIRGETRAPITSNNGTPRRDKGRPSRRSSTRSARRKADDGSANNTGENGGSPAKKKQKNRRSTVAVV